MVRNAAQAPGVVATTLRGSNLTYGQLNEAAQRVAQLLLRLGVQAGDRVALLCPPRAEALVTFIACCRIGAVWVGLNPKYKPPEVEYILGHAKPKILLSVDAFDSTDYGQLIREASEPLAPEDRPLQLLFSPEAPTIDALVDVLARAAGSGAPVAAAGTPDSNNAAMLVYTSGTTGKPKGALISERATIFRAMNQSRYFSTSADSRIINSSPINHVGGMQFRSLAQIYGGGTIVFQERFEPKEALALMRQHQINTLHLGPTMLNLLMAHEDFGTDILDRLDWYISAGAALPVSALKMIAGHAKAVASVYGATEAASTVSCASLSDSFESVAHTIGWPLPPHTMRVADEQGHVLPAHVEGELQVSGEYCMRGYLNDEKATEEAFTSDGWYRTGDLAQLLPDGSFKITGRIKEMFKSGGYNVYPREVEMTLESHPDVRLAAVVSVPDAVYQQVGHAFVILNPDAKVSGELIRDWCRSRLANYKIPKKIHIQKNVPMLSIGKVDKVALKSMTADAQ